MSNHAPIVAIIPARKGSKRVVNKNVRPFHGRPLAAWTFDLVREAGLFEKAYVSTDDDEVIALAGGDPLFEVRGRPEHLANDTATVLEVMNHLGREKGFSPETVVVLLQVTAPLRVVSDITEALRLFEEHGRTRTVVSVSPSLYPPTLTWELSKDGHLLPVAGQKGPIIARKQNHPDTYYWNDIVLLDTFAGLENPERNLFGPDPVPLVIPPERGVAIDYPVQLTMAEALFPPADEREK